MFKAILLIAVILTPLGWLWATADPAPEDPLVYDLVINGESFSIDANRAQKLQSRTQPGVVYEVALRIAQIQRLALNSLELNYDRGFGVTDDRGRTVRSATLRHELGFTMIVSDLGRSYDSPGREKVMEALTASLQSSLRDEQVQKIQTSQLPASQLPPATVKSQHVQYVDKNGVARTSLIYLLGDARYTCSCIVQFLDSDAGDVLPLVNSTLNSLRAR